MAAHGGENLQGVRAHAAGQHVVVANHAVCGRPHDGQGEAVVATGGGVRVLGGEGHQASGVEGQAGVVAGHRPLPHAAAVALERGQGDAVGAVAADHHLVAVRRGAAAAEFDGVVAALGGADARRVLHVLQLAVRREGGRAAVAEHNAGAAAGAQAVGALPARQQVLARDGLQGVAGALVGQQGQEGAHLAQAAGAAQHVGVVANERGMIGCRAGQGQAVDSHAAHHQGDAHVARDAADRTEAQRVAAAGGAGGVQGDDPGQAGRVGQVGLAGKGSIGQAGVVAHRDAERLLGGIDRQGVAGVAAQEGHVAVAHRDGIGPAEAGALRFHALQAAGTGQVEAHHAGVAEHQGTVERRGMVGVV